MHSPVTSLTAVIAFHVSDQRAAELGTIFREPSLRQYTTGEALLDAELTAPLALRDEVFAACEAVGIVSPAERASVLRDSIGSVRRHFFDFNAIPTAGSIDRSLLHDVSRRVPTGCAGIDRTLLCGGFLRGSVSEITGEAGTGKSHLALQTALHAAAAQLLELRQTAGLDAAAGSIPLAVVIVSENVPLQRFSELAQAAATCSGAAAVGVTGEDVLQCVLVKKIPPGIQPLADAIAAAGTLAKHPRVVGNMACVVVDSIAACIAVSSVDAAPPPTSKHRGGQSTAASPGSSGAALRAAALLKRLANDLRCAVVVVNQVRAAGFGHAVGASGEAAPALETPALGNAWASSVTARLHLRMDRSGGEARTRRRALLTLSSCLPPSGVAFTIRREGICDADYDEA
jgi:RecA/RadA recombinase